MYAVTLPLGEEKPFITACLGFPGIGSVVAYLSTLAQSLSQGLFGLLIVQPKSGLLHALTMIAYGRLCARGSLALTKTALTTSLVSNAYNAGRLFFVHISPRSGILVGIFTKIQALCALLALFSSERF